MRKQSINSVGQNQFLQRIRLNSFASPPLLSPMQLVRSPLNHETSGFEGTLSEPPQFRLEQHQQYHPSDASHQECPIQEEELSFQKDKLEKEQDITIDEKNMLSFILQHLSRNPEALEQAEKYVQKNGPEFHKKLFKYLVDKLKSVKKTKEEKVKYCIRKSFKYITGKIKDDKQAYRDMETNQIMEEYFTIHSPEDPIDLPFQKNSELKTMNAAFLKKIFKCEQYAKDYKEFLKTFDSEVENDNKKKEENMNEVIKKVIKSSNFNSLHQLKRLPWPKAILQELRQFAVQLFNHSPYKFHEKAEEKKEKVQPQRKNSSDVLQPQKLQSNAPIRKRSIILVSPPSRPKGTQNPNDGFTLE